MAHWRLRISTRGLQDLVCEALVACTQRRDHFPIYKAPQIELRFVVGICHSKGVGDIHIPNLLRSSWHKRGEDWRRSRQPSEHNVYLQRIGPMNCTNINYGEGAVVCLAGCSRVSPGCENCYAARLSATRLKHLPLYKGVAAMRKVGVVGSCHK